MVFSGSRDGFRRVYVDEDVFPPLFDSTAIDLLQRDNTEGTLLDVWSDLIEELDDCRRQMTPDQRRADSEAIKAHSLAFSYPEQMSIRNVQVMQDIDPTRCLHDDFETICRATHDWECNTVLQLCELVYIHTSTSRFFTKREISHEDGRTAAFVGVPESLLAWYLELDRLLAGIDGEMEADRTELVRWTEQLYSDRTAVIDAARESDMYLPIVSNLDKEVDADINVDDPVELAASPKRIEKYCFERVTD